MKRKLLLLLGLLVVAGAAYLFLLPSGGSDAVDALTKLGKPRPKGTIHIALLAPLRGSQEELGKSLQLGAELAVQQLNERGGILEQTVKLHVLDTRSDPRLARELTKDLAQKTSLSLITGTVDDDSALEAAQVAEELKIPFIYSGNGFMKTCKVGNPLATSDYVWGLGLTPHMDVEPFLVYLADKSRKPEAAFRVYYFASDNVSSRETTDFILSNAESMEFETVGEEYVDDRIHDLFQRVRSIFPQSPNLLVISFSPRTLPRVIPQLTKLGVRAEMTVASFAGLDEELVQSLGEVANEYRSVARWVDGVDTPENKAFLTAWKSAYPERIPTEMAVVGGYSPLLIAEAAYSKAGSMDFQKFRQAMDDLEIVLPQGKVVVSAINHLLIQPLFAVQAKDGRLVLDEYLGDVSHPGMEACGTPQPEPEQEAIPQRDEREE